jgi:hypothetical protein
MLCFGLPIYIYIYKNSTLGKAYGIKCGAIRNQWEHQNQYGPSPMALVVAWKEALTFFKFLSGAEEKTHHSMLGVTVEALRTL